MEESSNNDQRPSTNSSNGGKKSILRYPLRSSSKSKDSSGKSPEVGLVKSINKRGRPPSVSQSISVLELSNKDKSGKPPRRLSIPSKSITSPGQKPTFNITPISEARTRRSANRQEKSDTPLSDVSKSSARQKFNILTSASYWLKQIEVSESAAKHSISLGFFKLALEAQSEHLQLLREKLKSYIRKHNLAEYDETVRSLLESYEISETMEDLRASKTCSHIPDKATTPSDEGVRTTTFTAGTGKLKPKSLNTDTQASTKVSSKKETAPRTTTATKTRASVVGNPVNPRLNKGSVGNNSMKKKVQSTGKNGKDNGEEKVKDRDEKSVAMEGKTKAQEIEEILDGNKENLDAPLIGEISLMTEVN